jgi:WD40 repeat protein
VYSLAFSATGRRLLSGSYDRSIRVWEPFSNGQIVSWTGPIGPVYSVAFSPDGRRAYSGSADTSVVVWDVTRRSPTGKLPQEKLNVGELDSLWLNLASTDAVLADKALWTVVAAGDEGVAFLQQRVALVDRNEINKFIDDLDSDKFDVRTKATKALEKFGILIQGRLKEASDNPVSLEQKLRLDALLAKITSDKGLSESQEHFRYRRVMEILEQIGSPSAQQLLTKLIKGAPKNSLGEEASQSLKRLQKKKA